MSNQPNPFMRDTFNLTAQMKVMKESPALAARLQAEAKAAGLAPAATSPLQSTRHLDRPGIIATIGKSLREGPASEGELFARVQRLATAPVLEATFNSVLRSMLQSRSVVQDQHGKIFVRQL